MITTVAFVVLAIVIAVLVGTLGHIIYHRNDEGC